MTRRVVEVAGSLLTYSSDDEPPLAQRIWALVSMRLIDEITGRPPGGAVTLETAQSGFIPRIASDGLVGFIGIPQRVFPKLATQSYSLNFTILVEGFIALHESITIGMLPNFPISFAPTELGDLSLHREPVMLNGRTVLATGMTTTPLASVTISITGIWRTLPPANQTVAPSAPNLVFLEPALYFPRTATAGQLRRRDMTPTVGEDKTLLEWVLSGSADLHLSDRVNLSPGDLLLIDALNPDIMEYLVIDTIAGASTPDQPARIHLTYPLAYSHRRSAVMRKVTLQAPGPNNPFAQDAIIGDSTILLASMNTLAAGSTVEITDGVNPPEYHNLSLFSATSDAAGYFRLPPLSRVAQIEMQVSDGGAHPTITQDVSLDYSLRENPVDFVFH